MITGRHRAAGYIQYADPNGKNIELETRQCQHCGMQWVYQPNSGKRRGFCLKCFGLTCGRPQCDVCIPFIKQLEKMEGKKHSDVQIFIAGK